MDRHPEGWFIFLVPSYHLRTSVALHRPPQGILSIGTVWPDSLWGWLLLNTEEKGALGFINLRPINLKYSCKYIYIEMAARRIRREMKWWYFSNQVGVKGYCSVTPSSGISTLITKILEIHYIFVECNRVHKNKSKRLSYDLCK